MEKIYGELKQSIIDGKREAAADLTKQLLDKGENVKTILDDGLVAGMAVVGELFKNNEYFIPEVMMSARAMEFAMNLIEPILTAGKNEPVGTIVIGTVKGDLHDIGKKIVMAMLKGAGFKVVDLGTSVDAEKFADAAVAEKADIIGMSALLTTTMREMKTTIEVLNKKGLKGKIKVLVGGAPLTQKYSDEIGADAFGEDATDAVTKAKSLVGK